jgi:DNA-binding Xre family transcriptional regulator
VLRLRIKEVAQEKGLSMTKLSQRSEVAFTTVRTLFKDPYRSVTTDTLERLAKVLGVSPLDLLEYIPDNDTKQ